MDFSPNRKNSHYVAAQYLGLQRIYRFVPGKQPIEPLEWKWIGYETAVRGIVCKTYVVRNRVK